jgi:hypothetical protein
VKPNRAMFLSYERSLQPDLVGAGIIVPIAERSINEQTAKVIGRAFATLLLLSACLGLTAAIAVPTLEQEVICRAAIGSLTDRDPKRFRVTLSDGDILFLSYVRPIDNFDWTYRCRIQGDRYLGCRSRTLARGSKRRQALF